MLRWLKMRARTLPWLGGLLIAGGACWPPTGAPAQVAPAPAVLTNAAQLRALSAAEAAEKRPVRLCGVVTALNPGVSVFLQDKTGGTFVTHSGEKITRLFAPGDEVLVEGVTYEGLFLPGITSAKVTRVGRATLPHPVSVTYDDLLSGRFHYERVEVSGIVRSVKWLPHRNCFVLQVALGARKLDVELVALGWTNLPPLVDAKVRAVGLAAGYINPRRQLRSPALLVSRPEDLRVETPPPAEPYAAPLVAPAKLLQFNPLGLAGHRVRLRGVVTHQRLGEALFIRAGTEGLLVETQHKTPVAAGDVVDVLGFPAMGRFGVFLEDAEFRVVNREAAPQPVPSSTAEILRGTNDATLVVLEARLLDVRSDGNETLLVLSEAGTVFRARLPESPARRLRPESVLRLTGVCRLTEANLAGQRFRASPLEMELLLRSGADLTVLHAPSGWTTQRLMVLLGVVFCLALTTSGWVILLRRRLARQRAVILEKVQREGILEERHRMAREMHDTLAQSFTGLGFQLDALSTRLPPEAAEARAQLEIAREMVRHGREGLRRSLMNLRAQELECGDLTEALPRWARQMTAGTGIELRCELQPLPPNLPEKVQTNLLRIGQECLANAVQHARPGRIELSLSATPEAVRLRVADDGVGFEATQLNGASDGNSHFGWNGIRERAAQIRADIQLETAPGHGTAVTVTVPRRV